MKYFFFLVFILYVNAVHSQADNEIQVYASPTIGKDRTIYEMHLNYTFSGSKFLYDARGAKWLNSTLEITHGFGENFEIGFYTFTGIMPGDGFKYLGNQIRPRFTAPENWKLSFGASLSAEFGFFRPNDTTKYVWQGELRPIIDKTLGDFYVSFNPNIDFVVSGPEKSVGFSPQLKFMQTINQKIGIGVEYYGSIGAFNNIPPLEMQEHLLGPVIDFFLHPKLELQTGFLFGLTKNSNQRVLKLLIGKRT